MAELARIEIKEEELESLRGEIDSILDYVGQIKEVTGTVPPLDYKRGLGGVINVMREDNKPNESGVYTEALVAEFPESEKGYLKVKKIL